MLRPSAGSSPAVTVYTVPNCPDCHALKTWFAERDIAYAERNLRQPGVAEEAVARYGVRVAPITVVGTRFFYGAFVDQRPRLVEALDITA